MGKIAEITFEEEFELLFDHGMSNIVVRTIGYVNGESGEADKDIELLEHLRNFIEYMALCLGNDFEKLFGFMQRWAVAKKEEINDNTFKIIRLVFSEVCLKNGVIQNVF